MHTSLNLIYQFSYLNLISKVQRLLSSKQILKQVLILISDSIFPKHLHLFLQLYSIINFFKTLSDELASVTLIMRNKRIPHKFSSFEAYFTQHLKQLLYSITYWISQLVFQRCNWMRWCLFSRGSFYFRIFGGKFDTCFLLSIKKIKDLQCCLAYWSTFTQ